MKVEIASFTLRGASLAARLEAAFRERGDAARAWTTARFEKTAGLPAFTNVMEWTRERFDNTDALVYIGAAGIAVRAVAPCLRSKLTDPAVVSIDEMGRFAVSLLSGHIGGANRLAEFVADAVGGRAVVSTATDVNGVFSVDEWIVENGMRIRDPAAVRDIAEALLLKNTVGFSSEFPVEGDLPEGFRERAKTECGLHIGVHKNRPYSINLQAIPPIVTLGIGCRKGSRAETIAKAVDRALDAADLWPESVCGAASIDLKRNEEGLLQWANDHSVPLCFYSAEELASVEGAFSASETVWRITGVDNVCERAAVRLARGGALILRKSVYEGVTVAAAARPFIVSFDAKQDR